MSSSGKKIETYGGVEGVNELKQRHEEVPPKEGHKKKKSKKRMVVKDGSTIPLDNITHYNESDWEFDKKNMAEELNFVIEAMARMLGCYVKVSLVQLVLVSKSSKIQEKLMMIVHKLVMNEYVSAQEEAQALNKIMDFKKEHMKLIMDARAKLMKMRHHEMGNDKGKKRRRKLEKIVEEENNITDDKKQFVGKLHEELRKINEEASGDV